MWEGIVKVTKVGGIWFNTKENESAFTLESEAIEIQVK